MDIAGRGPFSWGVGFDELKRQIPHGTGMERSSVEIVALVMAFGVKDARQAKIADEGISKLADENVLWFQVTVDNGATMEMLETSRDASEQLESVRATNMSATNPMSGVSIDGPACHDAPIQAPVGLYHAQDGEDIGVINARSSLDLTTHTSTDGGQSTDGANDFDRKRLLLVFLFVNA